MRRQRLHRADSAVAASNSGSRLAEIPEGTKPAVRVHLRLATCRNLLMREARRSVERWGLTLPQFDVLAELSRAGDDGFTFVELSRLLLVTSGNLTGIVDRLETDGLVSRTTDDRDRRLVRIVLTRKGRQLVAEIMPLHARDIQEWLSFMTAGQLAALNEMLGDLRDGLRHRASSDEAVVGATDTSGAVGRSRRSRSRNRQSSRAPATPASTR